MLCYTSLRLGIQHFHLLHTEAVVELAMQQSWHVNVPSGETSQNHNPRPRAPGAQELQPQSVLKIDAQPAMHAQVKLESPARWNRTTSRLRLDGFEVRPQHQLGSSRHLAGVVRPQASRPPTKRIAVHGIKHRRYLSHRNYSLLIKTIRRHLSLGKDGPGLACQVESNH